MVSRSADRRHGCTVRPTLLPPSVTAATSSYDRNGLAALPADGADQGLVDVVGVSNLRSRIWLIDGGGGAAAWNGLALAAAPVGVQPNGLA